MVPRLHKHLNGDVLGNPVLIHQCTQKIKFRFRCRGKADFDLFEADPNQEIEHLQFFFNTHRDGE